MEETVRRCNTCRVEKPATLEYFPKALRFPLGINYACRECDAKRLRQYAIDHPGRMRATQARHRGKRLTENADAFRVANAAKAAKWRREHPERAKQAVATWRSNNPGNSNDHNHRARAQKVGQVSYIAIIERDGDICYLCGDVVLTGLPKGHPLSRSFDHVTPLVRGGDHSNDNIRVAHCLCNLKKGARVGLTH